MKFVIVDCGGFKKIIPVEKTEAIRNLQDKFPNACIEGDEKGKAKQLTGDEVRQMLSGRVADKNPDIDDVLTKNVKTVNRKGRGK